jgi:hypothetical protein
MMLGDDGTSIFCAAQPDGSTYFTYTLHAGIAKRGRRAAPESRGAAAQFHTTSRFRQRNRNAGFRMANTFIKLSSKG